MSTPELLRLIDDHLAALVKLDVSDPEARAFRVEQLTNLSEAQSLLKSLPEQEGLAASTVCEGILELVTFAGGSGQVGMAVAGILVQSRNGLEQLGAVELPPIPTSDD